MRPMPRDADLLIVGGDLVGLLLALLAAQRFMQVTVLADGWAEARASEVTLDAATIGVLERAGVGVGVASIMNNAGTIEPAALRPLLEAAAVDAGVALVAGSLISLDVDHSVRAKIDRVGHAARNMAARWVAGTHQVLRDMLGVNVVEASGITVAAQVRVGPAFLVGGGAASHRHGLSSGVGDADNLAWRLQAVHQGHAHDRLLDAYEAERHTQLIGALTGGGGELAALQVGQVAGSHPLVGNLVHRTLTGGQPLDARLNHGWAILTSDVAMLPHDLLCRWIGIGARIVMLDESLSDVDGAPNTGAVLVRPDRIVAAVAGDSDEFRALSEQLFGWYANGEPTAASAG